MFCLSHTPARCRSPLIHRRSPLAGGAVHSFVHRLAGLTAALLVLLLGLGGPAWAKENPKTAAATPASASADPTGLGLRTRACTVCHGEQGRSTPSGFVPRIAGKPAGYLANQLLNFRDGRRKQVAMSQLVEGWSDDYIREVAAYFATLRPPYASPVQSTAPAAERQRGRALATLGDGAVPACQRCHGAAFTGVLPATPGLLGLPRDYLVAQLGAWRSGQRRAAEPDCMARIARQVSPADIGAVAAWLAAQPVPADAEAVRHLPEPRPLDCGSAL